MASETLILRVKGGTKKRIERLIPYVEKYREDDSLEKTTISMVAREALGYGLTRLEQAANGVGMLND